LQADFEANDYFDVRVEADLDLLATRPPLERSNAHLPLYFFALREANASVARIRTEMPSGPIQPRSAPPECTPWSAIASANSLTWCLKLGVAR
jgi:hypothetical protein